MKRLAVLAVAAVLGVSAAPPTQAATTYTVHAPGPGVFVYGWMLTCNPTLLGTPANGVDALIAPVPSQYVGKVMPVRWTAVAAQKPPAPLQGGGTLVLFWDADCRDTGDALRGPEPQIGANLSGTFSVPIPPRTKYVVFHNYAFVEWALTF